MSGHQPGTVPPARVVAPFLVTAPLGLALAGSALLFAAPETLAGPSTPALLAAVHAVILGWLTLSIMGATLQLLPTVLEGRQPIGVLAQAAFALLAGGVLLLVSSFAAWRPPLLAGGALLAVAGVSTYLVAAARPLISARATSPELTGLRLAHLLLLLTVLAGLTWALALHFGWFPVTPGLVAAHAHLGLIGWLGVAISGVTYRLLPMFALIRGPVPRFRSAFPSVFFALALLAFPVHAAELPVAARFGFEATLALAASAWLADVCSLYRHRLRRKLGLYGTATVASFWFLALALLCAPVAVLTSPSGHPGQSAVTIACGFLLLGGWAGSTLIANSFKIVPFLAWYHRFAPLAGRQSTPGTADLYPHWLAVSAYAALLCGTILGALAALLALLPLLRAAGAAWLVAGFSASAALAATFITRPAAPSSEPLTSAPSGPRPAQR
ncbi:MAG: hypothetical protein KatS3mg062_1416 [Tepidiforma sp.]|nr:MAG: hypothetical protein KatS3mg062_1416 [Tepidiforma sp.]